MDEQTKELMDTYGVDEDTAAKAAAFMDEGIGEQEAVDIAQEIM